MMDIHSIFSRYRLKLETAGLLKPAAASQPLSPAVRGMRPSLAQVRAAMAERPDRFAVVQPSPMAILFEITFPAIEHVLIELDEERAEQIVSALCAHGQAMIAEHGIEGARAHLEELFKDLPECEEEIREEQGVERIIEAYRQLRFENSEEGYLRLRLGDKIARLTVNVEGMISLKMKEETRDTDLRWLAKCKQLRDLNLCFTQISDAGLLHLRSLIQLQKLDLMGTRISDAGLECLGGAIQLQELCLNYTRISGVGLEYLKDLYQLRKLFLVFTRISNAGLEHLRGMTYLQELYLSSNNQINSAGLVHLEGLCRLERLSLSDTQVGDDGLVHLRGLVRLQSLDLRSTKVGNAGLEHLSCLAQLQELDLSLTEIGDVGLVYLKCFKQLKKLHLRGTQTSPGGIEKFGEEFPELLVTIY